MFIIERCKRETYIKAWNAMYLSDKKVFNSKMFDGINPSLNKQPLSTEIDNFCTVAYDSDVPMEGFKYGKPIGIFSFVITKRKIIGKQFVVHPDYQGKGLGKALLIENEKTLKDNGYEKYYIGCSTMSARILKSWGIEPFSSDVEGDLYKFNVNLNRENFDRLYDEIIVKNPNIKIVSSALNNDSVKIAEIEDSSIKPEILTEVHADSPDDLINDTKGYVKNEEKSLVEEIYATAVEKDDAEAIVKSGSKSDKSKTKVPAKGKKKEKLSTLKK